MSMPLNVDEGYLFSLIDGVMNVDELGAAMNKTTEEISTILSKLAELGAVDVLEISDEVDEDERPAAGGKADTADGVLDEATKQEVMGMRLHVEQSNFYQMLGVSPDADRAVLRKAYFDLSRKFHTDAYYGKNLGRYRETMEFIFAKVTEAYNTLSRKQSRAKYDNYIIDQIRAWEMERSLAAESGGEGRETPNTGSGHESGPSLELFRYAANPAAKAPKPLGPPSDRREASDAALAVEGPRPMSPPQQQRGRAPERSTPRPRAPEASSRLGPASERIQKYRQQRGRSALQALLGRKPGQGPSAHPPVRKNIDVKATYGVEINLEAPSMMQTVEQSLAYRYARAGLEALAIDDLSAAVNAFEVSLELDSKNEQVADALEKVRDRAQGTLASSYLRQAEYEEEMGKHLQAAQSYLKALQHKSDDASVMFRTARNLLRGDGDLKKARGLARRAVGSNPKDVAYRLTLGEIYLKMGMRSEAGAELRDAHKLEPKNERVTRLLQGLELDS